MPQDPFDELLKAHQIDPFDQLVQDHKLPTAATIDSTTPSSATMTMKAAPPSFMSRTTEFGGGLASFGKTLFDALGGNPNATNAIGQGMLVDPAKEVIAGHPLKAAARLSGFNPDNIWNDYNSSSYGALAGDILPQLLTGAIAKKFGGLATKGIGDIIDPLKPEVPTAPTKPVLALPAKGESTPTSTRFYSGEAGIGDVNSAYPHNIGYKQLDVLPDIGAELAASRKIEDIPFRHPQGPLKPIPINDVTPPKLINDWLNLGVKLEDIPGLKAQKHIAPVIGKITEGQKISAPEFTSVITSIANELPKLDVKKRGIFSELFNLPKALNSWDLTPISSAPMRQGFHLIGTREWRGAWEPMVRAWGDRAVYDNVIKSITDDPTTITDKNGLKKSVINLLIEHGLAITDLTDLSKREESIASNWAETGIPIGDLGRRVGSKTLGKFGDAAQAGYSATAGRSVHASNRSYTAFLDKLRADTAKRLVVLADKSGLDPINNEHLVKQIVDFTNNATGRGSIGKWMEKNSRALNMAFFSPRMIASRLQMINPRNYLFTEPIVRSEYWKALGRSTLAWGTILGASKIAGADVSLDPTNSDFAKIKVNDQSRLDPGQGMQQELVLLARLFASAPGINKLLPYSYTSSTTGKHMRLGEDYSAPTRLEISADFLGNKSSPALREFFYDWVRSNKQHPFNPKYYDLMMPMGVNDIVDAWGDDPDLATLLAGLNVVIPSTGQQTYGGKSGNQTSNESQIKLAPIEREENTLNKVFNRTVPGGFKSILSDDKELTIPGHPFPYGKNPDISDLKISREAAKIFKLYPGLQEAVSRISSLPNKSVLKQLSVSGIDSSDFESTNLMGNFDKSDKSLYINTKQKDISKTLAHELAHANGWDEDSAQIVGQYFEDYLSKISKR